MKLYFFALILLLQRIRSQESESPGLNSGESLGGFESDVLGDSAMESSMHDPSQVKKKEVEPANPSEPIPSVIKEEIDLEKNQESESLKQGNPEKNQDYLAQVIEQSNKHNFGKDYEFKDDFSPQVIKERQLNIDKEFEKVLKIMKALQCKNQEYDKEYISEDERKALDLCEDHLRNKALYPIGQVDQTPFILYKFLENTIYNPLGYRYLPRFRFADVFNDLIFLDNNYSIIKKNSRVPDNHKFLEMILQNFGNIQENTSNFEQNKSVISSQILNILQKFHIYWNSARQNNQMNDLLDNTVYFLKNIVKKYHQSNDSMKSTTIHILHNIKEAYYRFMRAHKLIGLIQSKPAQIIRFNMIKRYKDTVERIRQNKISYDQLVTEMIYMLDFLRSFYIINYKKKIDDQQNQELYKWTIFDEIKEKYVKYKRLMLQNNEQAFYDVKDFTVTILLKMKHRTFIIFRLFTIQGYLNIPSQIHENFKSTSVQLFYILFEKLMTIPQECFDLMSNHLENCSNQMASNIIVGFYNKYQLFASVSGMDVLNFIRTSVNRIFKEISNAGAFDNYGNYKNIYFAKLFDFSERYRQRYHVYDMKEIEELEQDLSEVIEKAKSINVVSEIDLNLLNNFDKILHKYFISAKAKFNNATPI